MAVPTDITAFNAGEISPELYGAVDLKKLSSAGTTIRNMISNYRGGALSRGGTAFVGRCKQNPPTPPRPIPFQFSLNQGYILEFGEHYVRFVYRGGYVLESPVAITGATQALPCVIDVVGTPFANGDWVFITGVPGLLDYTYIVAGVASGHFSLTDLNGNQIDSTAFPPYVSGGTVSRLYTVATPYLAIDLPYLKYAQTADVMSLTLSNPITGHEYAPYDLTRLAADSWTMVATSFDAAISAPANVSASANGQAPSNGTPGTFLYQVTAVDAKGNESIGSAFASVDGIDLEVEGGTNTVNWSAVTGASFYNIYRSPCAVGSYTVDGSGNITSRTFIAVPPGSVMGFVGSSFGTQFADTRSVVDLQQTPPIHQDPFAEGQILAVHITGQGSGQTALGYTLTTSAGVNFAGYALLDNGQLGGFSITNPGKNYQPGDTIAFNGAGFASGAIAFGTTNPSANDTLTLNGVRWTFVATVAGANQTAIGSTLGVTLQGLAAGLAASANGSISAAAYSIDLTGGNLLIRYKTAGTGGNAYTLAASRATPSGATLTGGSGSGYAGQAASGKLTFSLNPTNTQTIVLDGVTWTFVTSGATGTQTNLGLTLAATLTQLAIDLNASANASIALATYSVNTTALSVVYKTVGSAGDTYTLGGGTAGATPSASTLQGGLEPSVGPAATLVVGPESGTYPGVNTYFQQRHFFANSLNDPDTFWATQSGLYGNMDVSIPTIASDAITDSPWTEQVNGIQWLVPMPGGLLALTGSRAWQLLGAGSYQLNSASITPASVEAQPQAFNGCNPIVPPIVIDHEVLYVEVLQTVVRDLSWNFWVNIYTGADLTILSSHLFLFRNILQWTWARNPYKVVWSVCDDGVVLALTYLKEQEVYGWTRHDTQGLIVGTASVTEPPVNAPYFVVQRFPPGLGGGAASGYVMAAMENYDSTNAAALLGGAPASGMICTDQASLAPAFNFASRAIFYLAFIVPGVSYSTSTFTNATGHTLTDGLGGVYAPSDPINVSTSRNFSPTVAAKDIDTGAVTFYPTYDAAQTVPAGVGLFYAYISAQGSGYTSATLSITGGTGTGLAGTVTIDAGGSGKIINVQITDWGSGYLVGDTLTFTITGDGTGATIGHAMHTPSDGAFRWIAADFDFFPSAPNGPNLIDPHTGDFFVRAQSCEIYHFRSADSFAQTLGPCVYANNSAVGSNALMVPQAADSVWAYAVTQQAAGTNNNELVLIPTVYTSEESTAAHKLAYVQWATSPFATDLLGVRLMPGTDGDLYILSLPGTTGAGTGFYSFRLTKFTPPSLGAFGANSPGSMTDITPWSVGTGPNADGLNYHLRIAHDGAYPLGPWTSLLFRLPTSNQAAAILKFPKEANIGIGTWPPDDFTLTEYACCYLQFGGSPAFDHHSAFVTGYMKADWTTTADVNAAAWAVQDVRDLDTYLDVTDNLYGGVDYSVRWLVFQCYPVVAGVVGSGLQTVLVQYRFAYGSAPVVLQMASDPNWDTAYSAYGGAIGNANVIAGSMLPGGSYDDSAGSAFCEQPYLDPGIYDTATSAFWFSGRVTPTDLGSGVDYNALFYLNSSLAYRAAYNGGSVVNVGGVTPPFLKLTLGAPASLGQGAYMMERMDNRLWQTVEDAYAVDAGVSNPMDLPDASLYASAASGTGVTFTADQNVFAAGDVGRILRMSGGIATVTSHFSGTQVFGDWVLAANPGVIGVPYAASGNWSLASVVTTLNAPHLAGMSVVGLADGVPIGPLTVGPVPFGLITLPFAASNVKVGPGFTAQLQTPYLNGPQVVQGSRKVIPAVTLRLAASGPCEVGTNQPDGGAQSPQQIAPAWSNLVDVDTLQATGGQAPPPTYTSPGGQTVTQLWTGDIRVVGSGAAWNSKGQVAVQQSLPLPLEVVSLEPEIVDGDVAERGYGPSQPGSGPPQRETGQSEQGPRPPGPWMISGGAPRI